MSSHRKRILVLYWCPGGPTPAIRRHLDALTRGLQGHALLCRNVALGLPLLTRFLRFDVAILHATLLAQRRAENFPLLKWELDWLRDHPGHKIAMPLDDQDHAAVLDEWLFDLGVAHVFTTCPEGCLPLLYPLLSERTRFHPCLAGYIDPALADPLRGRLLAHAERKVDVVCRARRLPWWFGRHGQLEAALADAVRERAGRHGLICDIATWPEGEDDGDAWLDVLASSRATLGVESGSGVHDSHGQVRALVRWLQRDPVITFEEVCRRLPEGWDGHRFFGVGPRHFEAVCTRTAQILVEGEYSGVLVPHRHYLPLRRDLANLDDVLAQARDVSRLQRLADNAYEDLCLGNRHSYASLAGLLDEAMQSPPPAPGWLARLRTLVPFCWVTRAIALRQWYPDSWLPRTFRACRRWAREVPSRCRRWARTVPPRCRRWAGEALSACHRRASRIYLVMHHRLATVLHLAALGLAGGTGRLVVGGWLLAPSCRRQVRLGRLVKELLLLRAAFQQAAREGGAALVLDVGAGRLVLADADVMPRWTGPLDWDGLAEAVAQGRVRRVLWARSSAGESVEYHRWGMRRQYFVGTDIACTFRALEVLLSRRPHLFLALLRKLLRQFPMPCVRQQGWQHRIPA